MYVIRHHQHHHPSTPTTPSVLILETASSAIEAILFAYSSAQPPISKYTYKRAHHGSQVSVQTEDRKLLGDTNVASSFRKYRHNGSENNADINVSHGIC